MVYLLRDGGWSWNWARGKVKIPALKKPRAGHPNSSLPLWPGPPVGFVHGVTDGEQTVIAQDGGFPRADGAGDGIALGSFQSLSRPATGRYEAEKRM